MKKGPGRPNLGRSATIRERAIMVYLPTKEMLEKWKAEAGKRDVSLSRYVVETVDDVMRKNPRGVTPREQLEDELDKAWTQITFLSCEVDNLRGDNRRQQETITDLRKKLLTPGKVPEESAECVPLLLELIQEEKVLPIQKALNMFGIGPGDTDAIRAIGAAVDALVAMGLVQKEMSSWRWTGGAPRKK